MTDAAFVLLRDTFGRVHDLVPTVLDGLSPDALVHRPGPPADPGNPVGWLVWHLARVQDDHLAGVAERTGAGPADQAWAADGWADRFALPYPVGDVGYGQDAAQVSRFAETDLDRLAERLLGYHQDVHGRTLEVLEALEQRGPVVLDTVVDDRWDPPVTAGVRLVSVLSDTLQHLGQAAYLRGLLLAR